jgi:hypothetical protein
MTQETDNLVLEHLRAIRSTLSGMVGDMGDIKRRVTSLEAGLANVHGDFAGQSLRMDRLSDQIDRINARLGIADA